MDIWVVSLNNAAINIGVQIAVPVPALFLLDKHPEVELLDSI